MKKKNEALGVSKVQYNIFFSVCESVVYLVFWEVDMI